MAVSYSYLALEYNSITPTELTVAVGGTATFAVSGVVIVSNDYAAYWCKGDFSGEWVGLENSGDTTWTTTVTGNWVASTLNIANCEAADAGTYFFVVAYLGSVSGNTNMASATLTVGSSGGDDDTIPSALPSYAFVCKPYGTTLNTGAVLSEFSRILVLDLNLGTIHPGFGFPITCTLSNTSPCAGNAQLPEGLFCGTSDGYIGQLFSPDAPGLGAPIRRIAFPVAAESTDSLVNITIAQDEDFLPLEDILLGLPFVIEHADGSQESGIIASNTVSSITPSAALSVAPVVGDTILISPMSCGVLFGERRYPYPSNISGMMLDVENRQGQTQPVTLQLFKAASGKSAVDLNDGAAMSVRTTDETRWARAGKIMLPRVASKALCPLLEFQPRAAGTLQISGVALLEDARTGGR